MKTFLYSLLLLFPVVGKGQFLSNTPKDNPYLWGWSKDRVIPFTQQIGLVYIQTQQEPGSETLAYKRTKPIGLKQMITFRYEAGKLVGMGWGFEDARMDSVAEYGFTKRFSRLGKNKWWDEKGKARIVRTFPQPGLITYIFTPTP